MFEPFESISTETRIGPKNAFLTAFSSASPGDVAAADEDRGVFQIGGTARKDRAVDEPGDILRRDAAVAEKLIDARIHGDNTVEHAGMGVSIELNENPFHGYCSAEVEAEQFNRERKKKPGFFQVQLVHLESARSRGDERPGVYPYPVGPDGRIPQDCTRASGILRASFRTADDGALRVRRQSVRAIAVPFSANLHQAVGPQRHPDWR